MISTAGVVSKTPSPSTRIVTGERRKGQGGILVGGDFRQEIQPVPLELFSRKTLAQRRGKRLLSPPAQRRVKFGRGAGSPFQRALPAGELSADSRGSAPPGASERSAGGCFRHPPRRAHGTLQPFRDESVIVGYTLCKRCVTHGGLSVILKERMIRDG